MQQQKNELVQLVSPFRNNCDLEKETDDALLGLGCLVSGAAVVSLSWSSHLESQTGVDISAIADIQYTQPLIIQRSHFTASVQHTALMPSHV